ncbi:hypothetical protein [Frankia sp. Cas4]|uniref:hypothetical protein n=1 Tax=Frankia sp. Cas4 TaxID=3073927 RepID=UPI002AD28B4A|nr:hypothetical protein [Frankia sp. Cas4]
MSPRLVRERVGVAVALAGAVVAVTGSLFLPGAAPARAAVVPVATTVPAPAIGANASVTVSQTSDLGFEAIHLSWKGFPSSGADLSTNEVRIYQCRPDPKSAADCYGSETLASGSDPTALGGLNGAGPDGPGNRRKGITAPDGTGSVDFVVETGRELTSLGCNSTRPCSLVLWKLTQPSAELLNSWTPHVAIPLTFRLGAGACSINNSDFTSEGAPVANLAMLSWTARSCAGTPALNVDYSLLGDTQARSDFAAGTVDMALTTRPAATGATGPNPVAYAPLAVSAISLGFLLDDPVTHTAITSLRLNARLVAKLLTQSYPGLYGSGGPPGCDPTAPITGPGSAYCPNPGTTGNPVTIFADPEFQALNPGVAWAKDFTAQNYFPPVLTADGEDLTHEVTRWLTADPDASAFLKGTKDPYGMHVSSYFLDAWNKGNVRYPLDTFRTVDPTSAMNMTFAPLSGLDAVVRQAAAGAPAGKDPSTISDQDPGHQPSSYSAARQGARSLFVLFDSADATNLSLPQAELKNAAGSFNAPTDAAVTAAVKAMTVDANGVRQADYAATDPALYPLALVHYAMVPTSGIDKTKAAKMADFIDLATAKGQAHGIDNGQLPDGYLSLPANLVAQAGTVQAAVRLQAAPASTGTPTPSTSPSPAAQTTSPGTGTGATSAAGGTTASGTGGSGTTSGASGDGTTSGSSGSGTTTSTSTGGSTASPRPSATVRASASSSARATPKASSTAAFTTSARTGPLVESTGVGRLAILLLIVIGFGSVALGLGLVWYSRGGPASASTRSLTRVLPRMWK